ncbi:MAG: hypothetical protein DRG31_07950, partial [Deltaproteobacteria bacterium]
YKLLVLAFDDSSLPEEFRGMGRRASEVLRKLMAETRACVIVDPQRVRLQTPLNPERLWELWKIGGIHAVVRGRIKEAMIAEEKTHALALVTVEAELLSTETGQVVKGAFGQNPIRLSRTQGPQRRMKALEKALEGALTEVRDSLLLGLSQMEWNTSVIRVEGNAVYINAGRKSGLKVGEELEVFAPGPEVHHPLTGAIIGRSPGPKKGSIRIEGFFGLDVAKAVILEGKGIAPGDMVKPTR